MSALIRITMPLAACALLVAGCRDGGPPADRPFDSPVDPVAGGKYSQIAEEHGPIVDPELDQRLSSLEDRMRALEQVAPLDDDEPDVTERIEALERQIEELQQVARTGTAVDQSALANATAAMLEDLARELRLEARFQAERAVQDEPSDSVMRRRALHEMHIEQPPNEPPPNAETEPDETDPIEREPDDNAIDDELIEDYRDF